MANGTHDPAPPAPTPDGLQALHQTALSLLQSTLDALRYHLGGPINSVGTGALRTYEWEQAATVDAHRAIVNDILAEVRSLVNKGMVLGVPDLGPLRTQADQLQAQVNLL